MLFFKGFHKIILVNTSFKFVNNIALMHFDAIDFLLMRSIYKVNIIDLFWNIIINFRIA